MPDNDDKLIFETWAGSWREDDPDRDSQILLEVAAENFASAIQNKLGFVIIESFSPERTETFGRNNGYIIKHHDGNNRDRRQKHLLSRPGLWLEIDWSEDKKDKSEIIDDIVNSHKKLGIMKPGADPRDMIEAILQGAPMHPLMKDDLQEHWNQITVNGQFYQEGDDEPFGDLGNPYQLMANTKFNSIGGAHVNSPKAYESGLKVISKQDDFVDLYTALVPIVQYLDSWERGPIR